MEGDVQAEGHRWGPNPECTRQTGRPVGPSHVKRGSWWKQGLGGATRKVGLLRDSHGLLRGAEFSCATTGARRSGAAETGERSPPQKKSVLFSCLKKHITVLALAAQVLTGEQHRGAAGSADGLTHLES